MFNNLYTSLTEKINKETIIAPCLFFGNNLELLNHNVHTFAQKLCTEYGIPHSYIFTLQDNGEKIKIADIKGFLQMSYSKPGFRVQIFIIENISRFTIQSANSCLKILEEPGLYNLFLLTNTSESGVMDTILSRTHTIQTGGKITDNKDDFYYSLIQNYVEKKDTEILSYFFRTKTEKEENLKFLSNIFEYAKNNGVFIELLEELDEDMYAIKNNNVSSKYIIDKYLLKMA